MRICSLLPSATEIVADLGFAGSLVGVSAECRWPSEVVGTPIVTAARIDSTALTNTQIDRAVRDAIVDGQSLYAIDAELIERLRPDVIVTQDLCTVCAVSSADVASACAIDAEIISLDPGTIDEVARSVLLLAERLGVSGRGAAIVDEMRASIESVRRAVEGRPPPRVFLAEWIDPPFAPGHWMPEMVEAAGGVNVLGAPGRPAVATTWERVAAQGPEIIVIAPCGFGAEDAAVRAAHLDLPCRAVAVDADNYYSRPAPRLADGVAQLGHLFHPDAVPDPGLPAIEIRTRLERPR